VVSGWNLVGAAGRSVATAAVVQTPGGIVASNYFDYGAGGYNIVASLKPGKGHWVKTSASGSLGIAAGNAPGKNSPSTNLDELNTITFTDAAGRRQTLYIGVDTKVTEALSFYDMPPAAPEFDARYTSGRMVETYPAQLDARASYEYPVAVEASAYPVTITWNVRATDRQLVLSTADGKLGNTIMSGVGRVKIADPSVKGVVIRVTEGLALPKEFALGQNYPNPFNPSTRFTVDVPKIADVTVAVYDILGRQITTLLTGQQTAGVKTIEWDGTDARGTVVPTGVYFVRMSAEDFSATHKIMLMK
jgi:hypothetical protein